MKNKLLTGLLALVLLMPMGVNAEITREELDSVENGNNSTSVTVTVGEVETPVYEVDIEWDELKFDWKYNSETNKYEWSATQTNDETLSAVYENVILIMDYSTGGEIIPSVKWNSNIKYQYVEGEFYYYKDILTCESISEEEFYQNKKYKHVLYTDSECANRLDSSVNEYQEGIYMKSGSKKLTTEEIPEKAKIKFDDDNYYLLILTLNNKTKSTETPTAGDTVGTVTITIKAAE